MAKTHNMLMSTDLFHLQNACVHCLAWLICFVCFICCSIFIQLHYRRSDMSMLELTPDFIKDFAACLSMERGLTSGTIWQRCMWLKGVVMRAHYNGKILRNPFAQFHISPNCKEREFLTEERPCPHQGRGKDRGTKELSREDCYECTKRSEFSS